MHRLFAVLLVLVAVTNGRLSVYHRHQKHLSLRSARYRISPLTGVRIALPTPEQLEWQAQEIGVLIHFNMATYVDDHDGCTGDMVPSISLFNPYKLSTNNWAQTMIDLGAKYAVLVAKHACGFLMAPTNVTFPLSPSGRIIPYNYTVDYSPVKGVNVLDNFVKSCNKQNIRHGFYYTVVNNDYLNVKQGLVQNTTLKKGQLNITQQTYDSIVLQQLRELWTNYGKLDEIWFDGGYTAELHDSVAALVNELQADSIIFGGYGVTRNPIRWIGNEFGHAPDPTWSTGLEGGGDPNSPIFIPAECDTTLQQFDRWFWGPHVLLRSLTELIDVYHRSVGHNCMLMIDLTPDRTGLIPSAYARRYKELGDFIRACYGTSVVPIYRNSSADGRIHFQVFDSPVTVDRSVVQEDQTLGQVIRAYSIDVQLADSSNKDQWKSVASGTSIGNKKIDLWQAGSQMITAARLNITETVDVSVLKAFTVHLCS
ncbi:unnamed protein product [Rotaria magnacalcarata]|uniref:alpha-L-fucosidase n=2 Tax=Rotaria magnacalcarata TaxID=392030 RepID=A0A816YD42_9BILA|nr:unnamed protein product [Rotaria magnacalcarata]CAF1331996.1 unnamed protein product [Rotaria magnacalcarata]CAF2159674.1 unnamed protein product [Rotaria magnacalcarata]CAF3961325.1 unnamed protein product [Rotaria magnacalcarata]CAF3962550.1 unnamed protein product [Rotaria magnacalcarata]